MFPNSCLQNSMALLVGASPIQTDLWMGEDLIYGALEYGVILTPFVYRPIPNFWMMYCLYRGILCYGEHCLIHQNQKLYDVADNTYHPDVGLYFDSLPDKVYYAWTNKSFRG